MIQNSPEIKLSERLISNSNLASLFLGVNPPAGERDPRVLKVVVEAVRKNWVTADYVVIDDVGHGFGKKKNANLVGKAILEVLDKNLK